ncbi:putative ion transporter superfamily protein YfcC [Vibrio crassostreae]|uniref:YfcC family protein n=1 Tax=Vibrio crassostreae TaxID=246167 RepID=UPI0011996772|nr:YfcC family protein [Vibrio crassostreae]TWD33244.1 putative ion transporter superfamily protein YfcC [Vibrio crassostreae]CAK1844331.1 putative ion transporter superfamily protein YfcC [Vibrio crassostreae]CAK1846324.1 putative ion transporter superfamily protein YfcC [Vibrio crassostreae]CAK1849265.1 putative ion transporter superfamily protein YfcC [Vibrio crassostreae]CAK1850750.1 putative ion transporter superfamily protein YfcC [Vibrio crassostreae]
MTKFKFPSAYTILMILTVLMAILTWVIPAGQYQMETNETLGRMVPMVGTYQTVDSNPQGIVDILMAPIQGFYDPGSYAARAVDVALFVLVIGGFLAVVTQTGAIDAGIAGTMKRLSGREKWMIPILMGLFALGGTVYGMAEETIPFYALLIPVMIAAGYDSIVGVAIIMVGAGIGCLGSTINPFATVIASNAAEINFMEGFALRAVILVLGWIVCVIYVMRYAEKVKNNPELSIVAHQKESNLEYFLHSKKQETPELNNTRKAVLAIFGLTFAVMMWGVSAAGWWMAELSALFLGSSILVGFVGRMSEVEITDSFVNGARDLLGVALIIAIARGLVVVMDNGNITHTILHYAEGLLGGLNEIAFINAIYWVEAVMCLVVPSSSGLAVLSMPVLAPLADFAGVGRELVVTAYQSASGLPNLVTPTSGVVMGGLAIGRVAYSSWLKFIGPLLGVLCTMVMILLSIGVVIS